ncbi:MAG: DNA sulfur modification protein DndE [Moraxellaceae bacterium]|nr:DNA sulfur modification protein DndE [Moraxellaceae bacterium]
MHYSKLRISQDASSKLRGLQQKVGITPNLICRYALMTSLESGAIGDAPVPNEDGQEFNAYTLTGEQTQLFLATISFVESPSGIEKITEARLVELLRSHIHRGIGALAARVKSPLDLFCFEADDVE